MLLLINFFESLFISLFYINFVRTKYNKLYTLVVFFIFIYLYTIVFDNMSDCYALFTYIILDLLIIKLFSKEKISYLFIIVLLMNICLISSNITGLFITTKICSCSVNMIFNNSDAYFLSVLLAKLLFVFSFLYLRKLKAIVNLLDKYFLLFNIMELILYVFNYYYLKILFTVDDIDRAFLGFLLFYILQVFVIEIILIICREYDNKLLYSELNNNFDSTKKLLTLYKSTDESMRILKHDLKQLLDNLHLYISEGEMEKAIEVIENNEISSNVLLEYSTGIMSVDCVLLSLINKMNEEKIYFTYFIDKSSIVNIDELDLAVLLSNLLNNAIENIDDMNRRIELKIEEYRGYTIITAVNTCIVKETNDKFKSNKLDLTNHGLGIKSIKAIVDKYNGSIFCEEYNGSYKIQFRMKHVR